MFLFDYSFNKNISLQKKSYNQRHLFLFFITNTYVLLQVDRWFWKFLRKVHGRKQIQSFLQYQPHLLGGLGARGRSGTGLQSESCVTSKDWHGIQQAFDNHMTYVRRFLESILSFLKQLFLAQLFNKRWGLILLLSLSTKYLLKVILINQKKNNFLIFQKSNLKR